MLFPFESVQLNNTNRPMHEILVLITTANSDSSHQITNKCISGKDSEKGLGSRRGEIGPAIEMHTDLKYVYMVYFIEKNRNFICLVLKL